MPVTGNEILSYKGEAALGAGPNTMLGSSGKDEAQQMNQRFNELANLNYAKNQLIWQEKVKDRDEVMKALASDKLQINQALPGDRPKLEGMLDDIEKFLLDNNGDVKSNRDTWYKFNGKLAKFREANIYAQSRYDSYQKGLADMAEELDPVKRDSQKAHWDSEAKTDLYHPLTPWQHTLDWDNSKVAKAMQSLTTKTPDPHSPFNSITNTRTKIKDSYLDYVNAYQVTGGKDQIGLNVNEWLKNWMGLSNDLVSPTDVMKRVGVVNARLDEVAKSEGFDPNDQDSLPVYLRRLNMKQIAEDGGKVHSGDVAWNDWFKIQLADQYKNENVSGLDEDLVKAKLAQSQIGENEAQGKAALSNAGANWYRAKGYRDYMEARANEANQKAASTGASGTQSQISQVYDVIAHKVDRLAYLGKDMKQLGVFTGNLPAAYKNINGVAINPLTGKAQAVELTPFKTGGKEYWKVNVFDPKSGEVYKYEDVYNKNSGIGGLLSQGYTLTLQGLNMKPKDYTYDQFIRDQISRGTLGAEFVGQNGTANIYSLGQSVKAINDIIASGKYDENIFSQIPPE